MGGKGFSGSDMKNDAGAGGTAMRRRCEAGRKGESERVGFKGNLLSRGLPRWLSSTEATCQCRRHRRCGFESPGWGDPLEEEMATHSRSCLENSIDRGAWRATVPGVAESQT